MTFDKISIDKIHREMETALQPIAQKYGITIVRGGGNYGGLGCGGELNKISFYFFIKESYMSVYILSGKRTSWPTEESTSSPLLRSVSCCCIQPISQ